MAKGQDQTLQIFLIVFTILMIGFAGATYFMYTFWSEAAAEAAALKQEKTDESARVLTFKTDAETYLTHMGFPTTEKRETATEQFKADMTRYAGTLGEANQNYRDVLAQIFEENSKTNRDVADLKNKVTSLEGQLLAVEAEKEKQIVKYEAELKVAEQDAASEREKFNQERQAFVAKQQQQAKILADQRVKFDAAQQEMRNQIAKLDNEIIERDRIIEKQKTLIARDDPSFEVPDGTVKYVNQAAGTVWINIGSGDGVRRQVTFAVVDTEAPNVGEVEPKGSIEVIRILGDHLAEARVTEDDPRDPILPGDQIFSQVWHRGQQLHFALTGKIDLNGDGRPDMETAKNLVEINGGVVDSWVDKNGKVQGEGITAGTRYLVLGEYPDGGNDAALRKAYDDMSAAANRNGVQTISHVDFMNQMGYKGQDRTVPLGASARSRDFRPRPNPTSSDMRPRSPLITP